MGGDSAILGAIAESEDESSLSPATDRNKNSKNHSSNSDEAAASLASYKLPLKTYTSPEAGTLSEDTASDEFRKHHRNSSTPRTLNIHRVHTGSASIESGGSQSLSQSALSRRRHSSSGASGLIGGPLTPRGSLATSSGLCGSSLPTDMELNDPVQGTTQDACISKLSAVTAGYYEDPYVQFMVRRAYKKAPLIHRGYYTRVAAFRKTVAAFVEATTRPQIVNLGAGFDTLYFWLEDFFPAATHDISVYEIDFEEVLRKKAVCLIACEPIWRRLEKIEGCRTLEQIHKSIQTEGEAIRFNNYFTLLSGDLRDTDALTTRLLAEGFDVKRPTLFISECALVYLRTQHSDRAVRWAASICEAECAFALYEQIHPHDQFGRMMLRNLELRGCPLLGIQDYPSLDSQKNRFLLAGWETAIGADLNAVQDCFVDRYELVRIQNLELMDEIEEYRLIQSHYFIMVATRGPRTADELRQLQLQQQSAAALVSVPLPSARSRRPSENSNRGGSSGSSVSSGVVGGSSGVMAATNAGSPGCLSAVSGNINQSPVQYPKVAPGMLPTDHDQAANTMEAPQRTEIAPLMVSSMHPKEYTEDTVSNHSEMNGSSNAPGATRLRLSSADIALSTAIANLARPPYKTLHEVATLFDTSQMVHQDLPRFTTAELRSSFQQSEKAKNDKLRRGASGCLASDGPGNAAIGISASGFPKLVPGPLSGLTVPTQHPPKTGHWKIEGIEESSLSEAGGGHTSHTVAIKSFPAIMKHFTETGKYNPA